MPKLISIAMLGTLLFAIVLAACSDEPAPTPTPSAKPVQSPTFTAAPVPTSTPKPTATATTTSVNTPRQTPTPTHSPVPANTPEPTPAPATPPTPVPPNGASQAFSVDIDAETAWQEVFDALSDSEQACLRGALGDELGQTLSQPVMSEDFGEWEAPIFSCLGAETATGLFVSAITESVEEEFGRELSGEEVSCLRELASDLDVAAMVAAGDESTGLEEFGTRMISCVPDFLLAVLGLNPSVLSAEESSCLRKSISDADLAAWLNASDDSPESMELITKLISCVSGPPTDAGPPLSIDEYVAWCAGMGDLSADDNITYAEFSAEIAELFAAAKAVNPPGEVADLHARIIFLFRSLMGILDEQPADGVVDPFILFAVLFPAGLVQEAGDSLAPDIQTRLVEAGCIEPSEESADVHGNDLETATAIAVGEAIQGYLGGGDDRDVFVFQAEAGQSYEVALSDFFFGHSGAKTGPLMAIHDNAGQEVARLEEDADAWEAVEWTAGDTGRFYVVLGDGASQGDYTLTVTPSVPAPAVIPTAAPVPVATAAPVAVPTAAPEPASDDDHADSIEGATAVMVAEIVQGTLDDDNDADVFVFQAEVGVTYQIDVELGTLGDSTLALFDSDEWELAYNDDHGDSFASRIVWPALSSGEYYVVVAGFGTGSYTLTVAVTDIVDDHANSITGATPVSVGEPAQGGLDYDDDRDFFVFQAEEGVTYQIDAGLGTLGDTWLALFDSDEWELAYNDDHADSLASRITWSAPTSGEYYVEVGGYGTGSYTLTIAVNGQGPAEGGSGDVLEDDHADYQYDATAISVGETVDGSVSHVDDFDWFSFQAEAGKNYTIAIALVTLDASWNFLNDAGGQTLGETYDESPIIRWLAPESGTYYVGTQGLGGTGAYTLTVSEDAHGDDPDNATAITVGELVGGALDYEGDGDVFAFQAEAGQTYQFDLALGSLQTHDLSLWTSDTGWMQLDQPAWEAQRQGEVYLAVWSSARSTGSYTLTITQP